MALMIPKDNSRNKACGLGNHFLVAAMRRIVPMWKGVRKEVVVLRRVGQALRKNCSTKQSMIMMTC
jgi:hypothetical protein